MNQQSNKVSLPPWKKIFLELAVRALRKLNFEFATWTVGQSFHLDISERLNLLNSSSGLKYILETDVCSAITLQFIHSGFTSGGWIDKKERRYAINREVNIKVENRDYHVDLFLNRYEIEMIDGKEKTCYSQHPVLIEAKRFEYFTPNLMSGSNPGTPNSKDIKDDIEKLRKIRSHIEKKSATIIGYGDLEFLGVFTYVMFWGTTKKEKGSLLIEIKEKLGLKNEADKNFELRLFPTEWNSANGQTTEWGWVCLYEFDSPADPKAILKCIDNPS